MPHRPASAVRRARVAAACAAAWLAALPLPAAAQVGTPSEAQVIGDTLRPFLTLDARVTMRTLTFRRVGYASVRLRGLDTARVVVRDNLPRPVQPGVVYRDVRVYAAYRIGSPLLEGALATLLPDTTARAPAPAPPTPRVGGERRN